MSHNPHRIYQIFRKLRILVQLLLENTLFYQNLCDPDGSQVYWHDYVHRILSFQFDLETLFEEPNFPNLIHRMATLADGIRNLKNELKRIPVSMAGKVYLVRIDVSAQLRRREKAEREYFRALGA